MLHSKRLTKSPFRTASEGTAGEKSSGRAMPLKLKMFVNLIVGLTFMSWLLGGVVFGYAWAGLAWVVAFLLTPVICLYRMKQITFPVLIWLPWIVILTFYFYVGRDCPDSTQSFFQMLTPLVVGCMASTLRPTKAHMERFIEGLGKLTWVIWLLVFIKLPGTLAGHLQEFGTLPAESISCLFFASCYVNFYACGNKAYLYHYIAMLLVPVVTITRGPMVAMLAIFPLCPVPFISIRKRVLIFLGIVIMALAVFQMQRVQTDMFYSGHGTISDLYWGNPDLKTSGRSAMWDVLLEGAREHPYLGHGMNASRIALLEHGFTLYLPHNDWLKIWYDFGMTGVVGYLLTMSIQGYLLVRIARRHEGPVRLLAYAAGTTFIPYAMIMLTDNVILYVQFFGNIQFALIGLIYGHLLGAKRLAHSWRRAHVFDSSPAIQQAANG